MAALALSPLACSRGGTAQATSSGEPPTVPSVRTSAALSLGDGQAIADVVDQVLPSVVSITSTRTARASSPMHWFFGGGPRTEKQQGLGSGVILSESGIVVTNHHVVDGAEEVTVRTFDDRDYEAKIVGTDPKTDIAVLQLEASAKNLKPARIGDSSTLRLGEVVLAIGNPFGVGQTVTMGIVSAKGRADMGIVDYEDFIQTDAAINPGNSGGALVNSRGELVGINTAILSKSGGSMGIGFAIPTSMAGPIVDALRTEGKVTRGFLGVSLQELNHDLAEAMHLENGQGVLISEVQKGGPADQAGLRSGDVVLEYEGKPVQSSGQLRNWVAASGVRRAAQLGVWRDGKKLTLTVKLGELPGSEGAAPGMESPSKGDPEVDGLSLGAITPELRNRLRLPDEIQGALVTRVAPGSPAALARIRPGDIILEVNRKPVKKPAEVEALYREQKGSRLLLLYRQGTRLYVAVK